MGQRGWDIIDSRWRCSFHSSDAVDAIILIQAKKWSNNVTTDEIKTFVSECFIIASKHTTGYVFPVLISTAIVAATLRKEVANQQKPEHKNISFLVIDKNNILDFSLRFTEHFFL